MKEYLSEQQRAQFERELAQDEGMLSEQQAQRAIGQGMEPDQIAALFERNLAGEVTA